MRGKTNKVNINLRPKTIRETFITGDPSTITLLVGSREKTAFHARITRAFGLCQASGYWNPLGFPSASLNRGPKFDRPSEKPRAPFWTSGHEKTQRKTFVP